MENKLIFRKYGLRAEFEILEDKHIALMFLGFDYLETPKVDETLKRFRTFAEAEYIGGTENKHRGLKVNDSSFGRSAIYVSHREKQHLFGEEVVIVTKNNDLEMESHFIFHKNAKAISTYNVVKNIKNDDIKLTYVPSFFYQGIVESNQKTTYLYEASNSWHCEAQWSCHSFLDLGIFNGNENTSMKRYQINNTGAWSTKEHLPMAVIEDKKNHMSTLVQIENNGSWHIEISDYINFVYLAASGPEYNDNHWLKVLRSGESFESVHATLSFGVDFEETIQEITKARRNLRRHSKDLDHLPVIYNDYMHALWDTQTTELILPLVDLAAELECDEFCIDAGWFAKGSDWWKILGKWEEYPENFPNGGFKAVIDYIKSKGLKAGIWFEIEAVGVDSPILKEMKDGWLFKVEGKNSVHNDRYQLNFANPEVYDYALKVIDNAMKLYNLDYIKIDYNVDGGVGNEWDSDSLGDGLLKHNRAYIKWLNEVMDKYPNLTIENCASGGCRMDYEILKYCPIQSTSDQTNYRKYPYLAANVLTACTPEQAAVWSYPLNDYEKIMPTDEVVAMNMCNAMLGRIHLASFINKLPENQKELIREGVEFYRSIVEMKKHSVPFFPKGTSRFFDDEVIGGIMDENTGILCVWNTSGKPSTITVDLSKYNFANVTIGYPLSLPTDYSYDQANKKLIVKFSEDYGGRVFKITR